MENSTRSDHPRSVLSQNQNNTTLWIGHLATDPTEHFAGQTFKCPSGGLLSNIQVYSSAVPQPGEIGLTLHEFNPQNNAWGQAIGHSSLALQKNDDARWIRFDLKPVTLIKDGVYGFRLQSNNAFIGIGEAVSSNQQPFMFGHEWNGDSKNEQGHFFTYFSLAFRIELCA